MNRNLSGAFVVVLVLCFAAPLSATHLNCGDGVADVALISHCNLGPLEFSSFSVSGTSGTSIGIHATSPFGTRFDASTGIAYLRFSISPSAGPRDILLTYKVTGLTAGIDTELGTLSGSSVVITENACLAPSPGAACLSSLQAAIAVIWPGGPFANEAFFNSPQPSVWIHKDIDIGANSTMSDFVNSHHWVPEPGTYALMGAGLVVLGLLRRKWRKR